MKTMILIFALLGTFIASAATTNVQFDCTFPFHGGHCWAKSLTLDNGDYSTKIVVQNLSVRGSKKIAILANGSSSVVLNLLVNPFVAIPNLNSGALEIKEGINLLKLTHFADGEYREIKELKINAIVNLQY